MDIRSIRFRGKIKIPGFGFFPSGNHVLLSKFYEIGKKQHLTEHPADKYRGEQMRATAMQLSKS